MKRIDRIKLYYEPRLYSQARGKDDHEIVGWESREAQNLRFEVLYQNVPLRNRKLLDVGCGVGSLLAFLNERDPALAASGMEYTGIDILENMVREAKNRNPQGNFLTGDVFSSVLLKPASYDIVFSSGLFNLNQGDNYDFFRKAFQKLCDLSKETVVLNLLHTRSSDKEDKYFYYHPDEVRSLVGGFCGGEKNIQVIDEYLPNDFTMIVRKK